MGPTIDYLYAKRNKQAFEICGVDYAGPYSYKLNGKDQKAWVCLFYCYETKLVSAQIALNYGAAEFKNCLLGQISRYGSPAQVRLDCQSAFLPILRTAGHVEQEKFISSHTPEKLKKYFLTSNKQKDRFQNLKVHINL